MLIDRVAVGALASKTCAHDHDQARHKVTLSEFPYSGIDWRPRCQTSCIACSSQAQRKQDATACCERLGCGKRVTKLEFLFWQT